MYIFWVYIQRTNLKLCTLLQLIYLNASLYKIALPMQCVSSQIYNILSFEKKTLDIM